MPMTEDLTVFFNADEFATAATHTPLGMAAGEPVNVIFDRNGLVIPELDVQTTGPTVLLPTAWWAVAEGDTITIAGTTAYVVRSASPVDDGVLTLITLAEF
jgi:hypothetical protein